MSTTERPGTVLSHYLSGMERLITDIGVGEATDVLLLEHDGFSAMGGDLDRFSERVLKDTGIPVVWTVKDVKK